MKRLLAAIIGLVALAVWAPFSREDDDLPTRCRRVGL